MNSNKLNEGDLTRFELRKLAGEVGVNGVGERGGATSVNLLTSLILARLLFTGKKLILLLSVEFGFTLEFFSCGRAGTGIQ